MQRLALTALGALLFAATGCTGLPIYEPSEYRPDPGADEPEVVWIAAAPTPLAQINAVLCEGDGPCNNAVVFYTYTLADGAQVTLKPDPDAYGEEPRVRGVTPQPCGDEYCTFGIRIGCHGNDVEAVCAPAVPSRILGAEGYVRDGVFYVNRLDLADAPTEDAVQGIRLIE